jgi:hypothetical protein
MSSFFYSVTHVNGWAATRLQRPFLSSPPTFLFPLFRVRINLPKIKNVLLFCFCFFVSFSPHSLECYFFCFRSFFKIIFFSILLFNIWLVRNWVLWFFSMVFSRSHDLGHEFERLTQVDIDFFFQVLILLLFFSILSL